MKQPENTKESSDSSDKIKIVAISIFLAVLLVILGILLGVLFRQSGLKQAAREMSTFPPASVVPTVFIPSTGCNSATLVLGATTFQIQDVTRGPDGSLAVPGDTSGIAYRVKGTGDNSVFVLSPTPQNMTAMSSISVGSPANVTWADCSSATYSLSAAQAGALDSSVFADQPEGGITVFFPTASSATGFVFKGRPVTDPGLALSQPTAVNEDIAAPLTENTPVPTGQGISSATAENSFPTSQATVPPPNYEELLAEIGLVDSSLSLFRTSLNIEVSIYNFGKIPITLTESDVSLTQPDGTPLVLKSSKPGLPEEIQPGETKIVELNFETPSSATVTLRILTVEYDIEGY